MVRPIYDIRTTKGSPSANPHTENTTPCRHPHSCTLAKTYNTHHYINHLNRHPPPGSLEFTFELTREAALRNFCILQRYNEDIGTAISNQLHTPLGYGLEFRPVSILDKLLHLHPHWCKLKQLLTTGSDWPQDPISDADRLADIDAALKFGNHKEAIKNPTLLQSLVLEDVTHDFCTTSPAGKDTLITRHSVSTNEYCNSRHHRRTWEHHTKTKTHP